MARHHFRVSIRHGVRPHSMQPEHGANHVSTAETLLGDKLHDSDYLDRKSRRDARLFW